MKIPHNFPGGLALSALGLIVLAAFLPGAVRAQVAPQTGCVISAQRESSVFTRRLRFPSGAGVTTLCSMPAQVQPAPRAVVSQAVDTMPKTRMGNIVTDRPDSVVNDSSDLRVATVLQDWVSRLTVNARAYLRYSYETGQSRKNFNEFGIDRFYLIMYFQIFEHARVRYTLEAGDVRLADVSLSGTTLQKTSGNLSAATKHLYFEYANFLGSGSYLRAGLHDLPWVPYEEDLWGYRVQGNIFADRAGYLTSSDLGIALGGRIADKYGSYQSSLVNGEGWKRGEVGRHKDWHTRITLNPLAGMGTSAGRLFVSGFRSTGVNDDITTGPATRIRTIAMAGYRNPGKVMLAGEQLWTKDPASSLVSRYPSLAPRAGELAEGSGYTIFGTLSPAAFGATGFASRLDLLARLDNIDPDDAVGDNDQERFITGLSWQVNPLMKLLLNGERVRYGAGALKPNESRLLLQAEVRF